MKSYLDLALEGKNEWWRYAIGYPLIVFSYLLLGSIPVLALALFILMDGDPQTNLLPTGMFEGVAPLLSFTAIMASFIPFLLATVLVVTLLHRRPLRTLITPASHVDWKRLLLGSAVWMLIAAFLAVLEAVMYPGRYIFSLDIKAYLPIVIVSLIFIPLQTSAEEFLFRGYLLQHAGLKIKNMAMLGLLSGFLFTLPHLGNPEVTEMGALMTIFYFVTGVFLALITLKDNGLELALGLHMGNNLFSALFASYANDAIQTPTLFTVTEFDMTFNLITLFVGLIVFYILLFKVWPRRQVISPAQGMQS